MNITKLIKHSDASNELLEEISNFKSIRWQYPLAKQLQWMENNLHSNDVHLLVYTDNKLIAYTNFVDIEVIVNDIPTPFMGIGNVCTLESGKGYGNILIKEINKTIVRNDWKAILLCKNELVGYYRKFGWDLIDYQIIESDVFVNINTMFLNFKSILSSIKYSDRNF